MLAGDGHRPEGGAIGSGPTDAHAPPTLEFELAAEAAAPSRARAIIAEVAADLPGPVVSRAQLAASELVTNAVRHGSDEGGSLRVRIVATPAAARLWLEVTDDGRTFPRPGSEVGDHRSDDRGGFGLGIVEAVADSVEVVRGAAWRVVAEFWGSGPAGHLHRHV